MEQSFVVSANDPDGPFPLNNLPFAVCKATPSSGPVVCVAIGDYVLNLAAAAAHTPTIFAGPLMLASNALATFSSASLNAYLRLGRAVWTEVRDHLMDALSISPDNTAIKEAPGPVLDILLVRRDVITYVMPIQVGDYTEFYSSFAHASNVGTIFGGQDHACALPRNWRHMPIAYHGRASSVVLSGTPVVRPAAQLMDESSTADDTGTPKDGPCERLDFQLEMGVVIGGPENHLGTRVSVGEATDRVFGFTLMNNWSAHDVQKWEYVPLGPFSSKNFATSISPFIVPLEALLPFRIPLPQQSPTPLPYLLGAPNDLAHCTFDVPLQVSLATKDCKRASIVCRSNTKHLYWTVAQQIAHHTVTGCNLRAGDLFGSGTISGENRKFFLFVMLNLYNYAQVECFVMHI